MDDNNNVSEGFGEVEERQTEESTEETSANVGATGSEEEAGTGEETQEGTESETAETAEPELTEKGTKLDPNPQSALHQQLANTKREKAQMEQVLSDPQLLAKFAKQQYGIELPVKQETAKQEEQTQKKRYTAADFNNVDDVANKINEIQDAFDSKSKAYEDQIKELATTVTALVDGNRNSELTSTMANDVSGLRSVPELDPKSSDFVKGLENKIAARYVQVDFDQTTGRFKGSTTLKAVADDFIEAIRMGRQSGSERAQTIVKDKSEGRVRTSGPVNEGQDTSKMDPGSSIAAGIARLKLR